jgi:hypothetical protein
MSLNSRIVKLDKGEPPECITLGQVIAANDDELTERFFEQQGLTPVVYVYDRIERELEARLAQLTPGEPPRVLPIGLKELPPEEESRDDEPHIGTDDG